MFKKSAKKNSLDLKVRISYDEKTDTISIQSKDRKVRSKQEFSIFLGGSDAYSTLRDFLEREGILPEYGRFQTIPEHLNYTHAINTDQWDKFPLGRFADGEEVIWDTSLSSNLLLGGGIGTGKSILQRNIIHHCLRHPENWVLYGFDPHRVELTPYLKHGPTIAGVATEIAEASAMVTKAHAEMKQRYRIMEQTGVNNFRDLPDFLPAWMIMIDEASSLLSLTGSKTNEGKVEDILKEEMKHQFADLAYLGKAAGIHLVMSTQRVEPSVFSPNFKEAFTTRIAFGRMQKNDSQLLLDTEMPDGWNWAFRGRGYFQEFGQGYDFQCYHAEKDLPYASDIANREQ